MIQLEQLNVKFVELRKLEKNKFFIRVLLVYQQTYVKRRQLDVNEII